MTSKVPPQVAVKHLDCVCVSLCLVSRYPVSERVSALASGDCAGHSQEACPHRDSPTQTQRFLSPSLALFASDFLLFSASSSVSQPMLSLFLPPLFLPLLPPLSPPLSPLTSPSQCMAKLLQVQFERVLTVPDKAPQVSQCSKPRPHCLLRPLFTSGCGHAAAWA